MGRSSIIYFRTVVAHGNFDFDSAKCTELGTYRICCRAGASLTIHCYTGNRSWRTGKG